VLGSRLAIWMLKEADITIYLLASDELRARRILNREGGDLEQIKSFTAMRDAEDSRRYMKLYGIDNNNYEFADIKIDTSCNVPDEIVQQVLDELMKRGMIVTK
jgi:cytidylate kinase